MWGSHRYVRVAILVRVSAYETKSFFFQAEDGIRDLTVTGVQTCALPILLTDVCLCEYMSHGHCGVTRMDGDHFHVLNDETVDLLVKTALSHARAGADMVAPRSEERRVGKECRSRWSPYH